MSSSETRKQLLYAVRRILRPVVRILIRAGIRFDEFAELARGVYVETAVRDGIEYSGVPSRERIAVVTGPRRPAAVSAVWLRWSMGELARE